MVSGGEWRVFYIFGLDFLVRRKRSIEYVSRQSNSQTFISQSKCLVNYSSPPITTFDHTQISLLPVPKFQPASGETPTSGGRSQSQTFISQSKCLVKNFPPEEIWF